MGSWNGTCAISNLHITYNTDVVVFILLENKEKKSFNSVNAIYSPCLIPFYARYDDYGSVEDYHGFGLDLVVNEIKSRLYEFGQGPNPYHDIPVKKQDFDIELLLEAAQRNRLGIQHLETWDMDSHDIKSLKSMQGDKDWSNDHSFELDRLMSKLKKEDTFRAATHVIVHGDVFRSIIEKWYLNRYIGNEQGNTGYKNNYYHLYFNEIKAAIPGFVQRIKDYATDSDAYSTSYLWNHMRATLEREYIPGGPLLTAEYWILNELSERYRDPLISRDAYLIDYVDNKKWNELHNFIETALIGIWINEFMIQTRKVWTKQAGSGSQAAESLGYEILANAVLDVLKKENEERDSFD